MKAFASLTEDEIRANLLSSGSSVNLENGIVVHTNVQVSREMRTPNGCFITLVFPSDGHSDVRKGIAELLLSTAVGEKVDDTT